MKRIFRILLWILAMSVASNCAIANELIVTCTSSDVTCNGTNDGTVAASVSGGILPYTYLWSNNESTPFITGLPSGTYSVTVTDAEGSSISSSCTVGVQNDLAISCTSTPTTCDYTSYPCTESTLVQWDLASCGVLYSDYSEFTPGYDNIENCSNVNASNVSRNSGNHSCNEGREGGDGVGICVGGYSSSFFVPNASNSVRFSVNFGEDDSGKLSALSFWEMATDTVYYLNNATPIINDYPTKYGLRVLKNGNQIFLQTDLNTSTNYSLEQFDLSGMDEFVYNGTTTFEFELYAYDPIGNGELNYIWDLDDISIEGCCGTNTPDFESNCDGTINCDVTGGSGQYSYSWTYNESFSTGTFLPFPVDDPNLDSLCAGTYCVVITDLIFWCIECVCIMVEGPSCSPIAIDDFVTVSTGDPIDINVFLNDILPDNTIDTSFQISSGPDSGTAIVNTGTGIITYTPDPGFTGTDIFNYVICNPFFCDSASVTITITEVGVNNAPVANDDFIMTNPEVPITIDVQANDYDPDGDLLVTSILNGPINGIASVLNNDSIYYESDPGFEGTETITYIVSDGNGNADSAIITIIVTSDSGSNDSPVAIDDNVSTSVDASITIDVQANDLDPNGDPLTTFLLTLPLNGTVTILNGDSILYDPNLGFDGTDAFTYLVSDGNGGTDNATVTINVSTTNNECPDALNDSVITDENIPITFNPLVNDSDSDNGLDPTSVTLLSGPVNGTATVDPVNGEITYTPGPNFMENDLIVYQVCDFNDPACCDIGFIFVSVIPDSINNCPIVLDNSFITDENISITFNPLANDSDGDNGIDPTSVTLISGPVNGVASADPVTGQITYTPNQNFIGNDLISYSVCDLNVPACCETGFVSIAILPDSINNCISALGDEITTEENQSITFNPLDNDSDLDDGIDSTTVTILSGPSNGNFNLDPFNGAITYTPNSNFIGLENLSYSVCDLNDPACCDTALISITILADSINNCPIVLNDSITTDENMAITFDPLANDFDIDSGIDHTSVSILSGPVNGTATVDPVNGEITYSPGLNFIEDDLIAYEVCDLNIPPCCEIGFIVIDILPDSINNCPSVLDDFAITDENVPIIVDPLDNDIDLDNGIDSTSVSLISGPANGTANVDTDNGEITYTPDPNFAGNDIIGYSVCDLSEPACCEIAFLSITILPDSINNCPVAMNDTITTDENIPITFNPLMNDTDTDNGIDPTSVSILSGPLYGIANVDSETGEVSYTPDPNFSGSDLISYSVCDLSEPTCCDFAFIYISVIGCVNSPLTAVEDNVNTDEDTPVVIPVLANDIDIDGDINFSSLEVITPPDHGSYQVDTNTGTILYQPESNFFGLDSLVYQVSDTSCSATNFDTAKVLIMIDSVNDCPIASNDTTLTEQGVPVRINVHDNDSDIDGSIDTTSVFIIGGLANGTANVDPITGEINYVPFSEYMGPDSINYVICDNGSPACCDTATVYVDVVSIADAICIPKAFSPNGDTFCDLFVISPNPKNYPQNELKIFNRWGNCVYEMRGYNNTWDGTSNTGGALYGDEIHDGTYFFVFDLGNGDKPLNGSVVIKRK